MDESIHYDRLLLRLDFVHQDYPGGHPVTGIRQELLDRVEVAVEKMLELGGNGLKPRTPAGRCLRRSRLVGM